MRRFKVTDDGVVEIFDMANIDKRDSNLPVNIWVDSAGSNRHTQHDLPRVKIQKSANTDNSSSNLIPVSISTSPQILSGSTELTGTQLRKVFEFISRNSDILIKHWRNEITDRELFSKLKF